jgi:hypothetical protein
MTTRRTTTSTSPRIGADWRDLLNRAVTEPGTISTAFRTFHGYSIGNQMLALWQCYVRGIPAGPINTYKGWQKLGRQVRRDEKAVYLWMPIPLPEKDANGEKTGETYTWFALKPHWFILSQTDGEAMPDELPADEWNADQAERALDITRETFQHTDGNAMGYAIARRYAVNPLDPTPVRTRFHEFAHVLLGHTAEGARMDDTPRTPRHIREVEAEGVALLCAEALQMGDTADSRGYIQGWLHDGETISEQSARRIFSAAQKVLTAGLPAKTTAPAAELVAAQA